MDVRATASAECDGTAEETTRRGDLGAALLHHVTETGVQSGSITGAEVRRLAEASRSWGRHPDAFDAILWCEALGFRR